VNKKNQNQQPKKKNTLNKYAHLTGIGFQMIVIIGLGVFAGKKLDQAYPNNNQLFTIVLTLIAVVISMIYVIIQVGKISNKNNS
jgi:F0F1-type ATP synthase assembly protein I